MEDVQKKGDEGGGGKLSMQRQSGLTSRIAGGAAQRGTARKLGSVRASCFAEGVGGATAFFRREKTKRSLKKRRRTRGEGRKEGTRVARTKTYLKLTYQEWEKSNGEGNWTCQIRAMILE